MMDKKLPILISQCIGLNFVDAPEGAFPLGKLLRQHIANNLLSGQHYDGFWNNVGSPA